MGDLIGLSEISMTLNVTHDYARDRVVKRPDFPRPAISLSQKCRRWKKAEFETWLRREQRKPER
jgi:predicted DNA-binding transcriptional regulator AlpA